MFEISGLICHIAVRLRGGFSRGVEAMLSDLLGTDKNSKGG
jgi:hypothetical protein